MVLNETFATIWSAAVYVAEKAKYEPGSQFERAFEIIQQESGLTVDMFDFARHPWLDYFHTPDVLTHVIDSIPPHLKDTVDRYVTYETCTRAHVQEYDKFLKGKIAIASVQWSQDALNSGRAHYPYTYVPVTLPDGALPPDVIACETFAHWMFERAQLSPLMIYPGEDQLLWVMRTNGPKNPNSSYALKQDVSGEAWAVSLKPIFPTRKHGEPSAAKKQVPATSRPRGGKAKNDKKHRS